mmetsp:Transcript_93/g.188  ORF Transcript_93/g.188 Transcript_93/m.188 type:complete len:436 (-) Transcript_93:122-1429(-)|eukprot:CAMPEP_0196143846 /NCGR_PEP_ID=MMETSP0910-20130528/13743_1 /TAXON_ID=49265 /ORGANISM="Thalassiosira rotula, Strain GSO102" /LENGTH=435 /DNA_ID=CAMNT_0041405335 /DNA_START=103 /DNA_END=1410 /DNA_ORIENTATION=+
MPNDATTLSAAGLRARVTVEQAEEICKKWQAQLDAGAIITKIDVSCRAWPLECLLKLETALSRAAPTVQILQIDDIIASLPTDDGFASLGFFNRIFPPSASPKIHTIDLSDNALGTRALLHIPDLLARPGLERLRLTNCGMSKEVAEALATMLMANASELKELRLGRNQMHKEGAASIATLLTQCTRLEQFGYDGSRPLREGTVSLVNGLQALVEKMGGTSSLVELDLNDCFFGSGEEDEDALPTLLQVIRASPHLTKLIVKDGGLELTGFEALVEALVDSGAQLKYLDVGALDLEEDGATALAEYIRDHLKESLVELHAETNTLEDAGVQTLLDILVECPNLRVLDLTENLLEADGFQALVDNRIPSLQKLVIKENMEEDIDDDVVETIRGMYSIVLVADDDREETTAVTTAPDGEVKDGSVDDLAGALGAVKI